MAWKECSRVDQRVLLVSEFLKGEQAMAELCRSFGVSRKTAYKWVGRYQEEGPKGLVDRSRAPLTHSTRVPEAVLQALLEARGAHPHWGARKVLAWLSRKQPGLALPVASTVSAIFARYGLVRRKTGRRTTPPYTDPFADADVPNRVWCADFKGDFRLGNGKRCYPLTITDACSRMLLRCSGLCSTRARGVQPVFEAAFREYGLPEKLRTDNGTPFASRGAGGLSRLSIWWTKLGIRHERIQPGHPEQNGRHERMHRTLKQETTRPAAASLRAQQAKFDDFIAEYNTERPHEALSDETPGSHYSPSLRAFPSRLPRIEYPSHFEVRTVASTGRIRWKGSIVPINKALRGELVGIEAVDGVQRVYFSHVALGFLDEERPGLGLLSPPVTCWARWK